MKDPIPVDGRRSKRSVPNRQETPEEEALKVYRRHRAGCANCGRGTACPDERQFWSAVQAAREHERRRPQREAGAHRPRRPRRKRISPRQRPKLSDEAAGQVLDRAIEASRTWLSPRRVKWDMPARLEALAEASREHAAAVRGGDAEAIQRTEAKVQQAHHRARELAGLVVTLDLPPKVRRKLGMPQSAEEELQGVDETAGRDRERLDALVREKRKIMLSLTREGANPTYILSVLIRYAEMRTAEFPGPLTILMPGKLSTDYGLEAERPRPLLEGAPAVRVTFKKDRRIPRRKKPRKPKPGPHELAVSAGMTLLYRHLRKTTGSPRLKEIGVLFAAGGAHLRASTFGPSVYRRVRRLRTKYGKQFSRLVRHERTLFRAHTGTDLAL